MAAPSGTRPRRTAILLVAALALLFQWPFYDRWASLMDEGHMLQFADIVADGGELYRDAPVYPLPGAFYLLAGVFRVAGASVLIARRLVLVEFALLCAFAFVFMRRLVPPAVAAASVGVLFVYRIWAFPHWQMYSYSSTALLCLAGGLVALARFLETGDRRLLCLAGLAAGLAAVTKQDYGAAGLVAMNLVLLVHVATVPPPETPRRAALFAWLDGPPLALGLLTAVHFWRQGLLAEMLRQTVFGHLTGIATFDYPGLPALRPLFTQDPRLRDAFAHVVYAPPILFTVDWPALRASWLYNATPAWDIGLKVFFYAPYLLVVAGAVRLWYLRAALRDPGRRTGVLQELTLYAVATALCLSLNRPRDYVHLSVVYWTFLLLGVVYAHRVVCGSRWRSALGIVLALGLALVAVPYTARLAWRLRTEHPALLAGPRGGIRVKPAEATVLAETVSYVQRRTGPADTVAVFPYFPLLSFLAERRGPDATSYVVWPVKPYPDRDQRIIDAMEAKRTPVVVYSFTQWVQFPRFQEYAPDIFAYLSERYALSAVFSPEAWGYVLGTLDRRAAPPAGTPVAVADAKLHIDTPGEAPRRLGRAEREAFMATGLWPFREAVALKPLTGGRRTVLTVPLAVPAGARLETAVAVHPDHWVAYPGSWVDFTVAIDGERVFAERLDPQREVRDRRWVEISVPLERWGGRTVPLELSVACERAEAETLEMAGFAVPRLVVP